MEEKENENIDLVILCPNCNEFILIEKLNCCIFRHAFFIASGKQIDPHSPKSYCNYLIQNNLIYGCGKPFKIVKKLNKYDAIICDYI
jgi:DNA-directed RNA polymerase subunit RPC12/RpoP